MLSREDIKVLRQLVDLAIDTRTDIETDDNSFSTLSVLQARLIQMEIAYDQANKFRRANKN